MSPMIIAIIAVVVAIPLVLAIAFKVLWKVPAADEALIDEGIARLGALL